MKTSIKKLFLLPVLAVSLGFVASQAMAQPLTLLHTFVSGEGAAQGIAKSGDTLYGVTYDQDSGLVYSIKTDGTGYTVVHNFATNGSEGFNLYGHPIISGNTLYGTASTGGNGIGYGTIYKVDMDGSNFAVLHSFSVPTGVNKVNSDGTSPWGNLVLAGGKLYGTATLGGNNGRGTIFSINPDGTGFTTLHHFDTTYSIQNPGTQWGLIVVGNKLFGTTRYGGLNNSGTVFSINTDGTGFTTIHAFNGSNGYGPTAGLTLSGSTLYGTTANGGGSGNVFKINTDGSGFAVLHNFTVSDGRSVLGEVDIAGDTLYGTTFGGGYYNNGTSDNGTVYSVKTDGSGFTSLHSFSGILATDGGGLSHANTIVSDGVLYGTTSRAVFRFELPCDSGSLNIAQYAGVTVSGSVGCTYRIDYTTSLTPPVTWTPLATNTLVNGSFLYLDTNVVSGSRFYQTVLVP